jgi:hypothetical protein
VKWARSGQEGRAACTHRKLANGDLHITLVGIVLSCDRHNQWLNEKFAAMVGYSREG